MENILLINQAEGRKLIMFLMVFTIIVFNSIVFFIPKRLSKVEMYTTSLFAIGFHLIVDLYLDVKYGLYGYFDPKVVNWATLGVTFGIYPAVNVIFLNLYPFHQKLLKKGLYLFLCSAFAVFYEWIAVNTDFFYHNGWNLMYSALAYPLIFLSLLGNFYLIMKLKNKEV